MPFLGKCLLIWTKLLRINRESFWNFYKVSVNWTMLCSYICPFHFVRPNITQIKVTKLDSWLYWRKTKDDFFRLKLREKNEIFSQNPKKMLHQKETHNYLTQKPTIQPGVKLETKLKRYICRRCKVEFRNAFLLSQHLDEQVILPNFWSKWKKVNKRAKFVLTHIDRLLRD